MIAMQAAKHSLHTVGAQLVRDRRLLRTLLRAALLWPVICLVLGLLLGLVSSLSLGDEALSHSMRIGRARQVWILAGLVLTMVALVGALLCVRQAWRRWQGERVRAGYRIASEASREGLYLFSVKRDADHRITDFLVEDCNERAAEFVGKRRHEFMGAHVSSIDGGKNTHVSLAVLTHAMAAESCEDEFRVSPFGQLQASWIHRRLIRCGDHLAMTLYDITAVKAHAQALARMANNDALTKLPNRHWLQGFLPGALERAADQAHLAALLVIDLDNFKNINDTLGHAAGDELLQAVAFRIRAAIRPNHPVVRLGGDEFLVVIEHIHGADEITSIASRLINVFADPFTLGGNGAHSIRASIGVSVFPGDGTEVETLLKHADLAMYAAKDSGKAHFEFYQPQLSEALLVRLGSEEALRQAIEGDQFVVYYQPRVDARSGQLCSMEALIRWQHPQRGLVPPIEFIPLAETTGMIVQIGAVVVEKVCAQLAQWRDAGLPIIPVSVNVSSRQLVDTDLQALFRTAMARHRIDPDWLEVELTESCMMGEDDHVVTELAALQSMGLKLLVDDFGTGYSSLSQLQRLNFDVLKVDMAFTAALGKSKEGEVFFKAIVWMAHALGMRVVAEGVETGDQLRILQRLACDEIQGYLISRPVPAADMIAMMQRRTLFPESVSPSLTTETI